MRKKRGCQRPFIILLFSFLLLYFAVGNGKIIIMKMIYPIKFQEYVETYSEEFGLDKYLVYAVIKTESGFDPNAVSNAGAKGLMQIMEKTASECNEKNKFGYSIPEDLFIPEKNIKLGCCYLRHLMDTYGDVSLAITAYNGGTGNVKKWLNDERLSDGAGGLADIPYAETRDYVDKVISAYDMYVKIYKQNQI